MTGTIFGRALQEALQERQISGATLAREIGVSPPTVSAWSTGSKKPSYNNAVKLEELFDIRPRGRWLSELGYETQEEQPDRLVRLEDHIHADDTISPKGKRALLAMVAALREGQDVEAVTDEERAEFAAAAARNQARRQQRRPTSASTNG